MQNKLKIMCTLLLTAFLFSLTALEASERDRRYSDPDRESRYSSNDRDENPYSYCKRKAMDITGYDGRTPKDYKKGQALEGALKGAASGATLAWIAGKDKEKAAKKAAGLGLLIGAIKQGKDKERQKKQDRLRRDYQYELDNCMYEEEERLRYLKEKREKERERERDRNQQDSPNNDERG